MTTWREGPRGPRCPSRFKFRRSVGWEACSTQGRMKLGGWESVPCTWFLSRAHPVANIPGSCWAS